MNPPEGSPSASLAALWELLRGRRFPGLKFRRQAPLDRFVVDSLCLRLWLVIELDGGIHDTGPQRERDRARDAALGAMGYTVPRFPNELVLEAPEAVLRRIEGAVGPLSRRGSHSV